MNRKFPSLSPRRVMASLCLVLACVLLPVSACYAAIANAWHIPDDSSNLGGTHMRNPEFEFDQNTTVTFYTGLQKFNNVFGTANQTGGTLYVKKGSATTWTAVALGFDSNNGNNQYWKAAYTFSAANGYAADDVIQYYFALTFDGTNGLVTTYLYGAKGDADPGAAGIDSTATESVAQAKPYSIRNRAAFIYHNNNRVVSGSNVTFTTEVGYVSKSGSQPSVTNGALYYTTDGSTPTGSLGSAGGSTTAVALAYDHTSNNASIAGNSMYWTATAALPTYTTVKYKIGLWNTANNEEKFADYNTSGTNGATFSFSNGAVGDPVLTVNGTTANYTTTHVFANEVANDQIPVAVFFDPGTAAVDASTIQIYTNLNRRDYATLAYTDGFGLATQEGIEPPSGDVVGTNDSHYYKAYAMSAATGGGYSTTLYASKTGAYRLTARYKLTSGTSPNPNPWVYYTSNGRRDHAIVVSPVTSRDIRLYELNTLNIDATGQLASQRSTFADLHDSSKRFNLNYLSNLGCNWLWFQPIHPNGIDGRQDYPNTSTPYNVGSPYAVKNFFEIMPLMSKAIAGSDTNPSDNDPNPVAPSDPGYANSARGKARTEFHDFVVDADTANVGVMLDAPFNHTSYDAEFGYNGIPLFAPSSSAGYTGIIENAEARVYSNTNNYALRASGAATVAVAPDRTDFGKFGDVHDIYFGTYSALVDTASDSGNYLNEGDQFFGYLGNNPFPNGEPEWNSVDFSVGGVNNNITRNTWRYFASYIPYWLSQTGHVDGNGNLAGNSTNPNAAQRLIEDSRGIDGLRADFGQGLPPQCWEYIINVARSYKWNFVFMTESLDGGAVTYRSNRHFDILNENIVFSFQNASNAQNYRDLFDNRRNAYGQSLVLMNSTSHDEAQYTDPFQALIRYMVAGTIDGVPMVFYGQENGISTATDSSNNPYVFGFDHTELNFGKAIVNFKQFNSLGPVLASVNRTFALDQLYPDFAAVGQARAFSPALRSSNRYYLNQTGSGGIQQSIFSIAKYQTANAYPGLSDVVFGFVNLDRNNTQSGNYNVNITQNGTNLFGIQRGRSYNVRNISAYLGQDGTRRGTFLIPNNVTGDSLLDNGLYVALNPVPTSDNAWKTAPFEAQYLKLYDVTPPPTGTAPASAKGYALGNSATFNWSAVSDPFGGVSGYRLIVSTDAAGQNVLFSGLVGNVTSYTLAGVSPGQKLYARIAAVNNAGIEGPLSAFSMATPVLDPAADADGDGQSNAAEDLAGTNPLDATSILRIAGVVRDATAHTTQITWSSVVGKQYQVEASSDLGTGTFTAFPGTVTATGTTATFTDTSTAAKKFYRVRVIQ